MQFERQSRHQEVVNELLGQGHAYRCYCTPEELQIMRETAEFWLDHLAADSDGYLSSSPSYSPEHGTISAGAYMDVEIVWDPVWNPSMMSEAARLELGML